jgi:hypothetical protein
MTKLKSNAPMVKQILNEEGEFLFEEDQLAAGLCQIMRDLQLELSIGLQEGNFECDLGDVPIKSGTPS